MKRKKKGFPVCLVILCSGVFLMAACGKESAETPEKPEEAQESPDAESWSLEDMPVHMEEVVLSDMEVMSNGVPIRVQLVMTEGDYFTEEYAGAGGGTYEENYSGTYELRARDERGELLSVCPVKDEFGGDRFNFGGPFQLALADYNQDGCVDFTIGTWGSSSMGIYYLYTILESGEIALAYPEGITDCALEFSHGFEVTESGFVVYIYNNATGIRSRLPYDWDETRSEYVPGEEVSIPEGETEAG